MGPDRSYRAHVTRVVRPADRRRPDAAGAERSGAPAHALARLQRSAGNRAVGRILARAPDTPSIKVRNGSKLKAAEFVAALKRNDKVPKWLKSAVSAKGDQILLSGELKPPSDKIWLFDETFAKAFAVRDWEITTAKSTIQVTDKGWRQMVVPDLGGERLGTWMKTGRDQVEFSSDPLFSQEAEAIYGWTIPRTAISSDKEKHNLIVIVTEIEVTRADGKTKTFTPGPDQVAEAIIHEIGIHAGRISSGLSDVHDGSAVIREVADQIGGFFRKAGDSGDLELGQTSKDIFKFAGGK
jgi:hypothetical protein